MTSTAYLSSPASGIGLATVADDVVLDVWYPRPALQADPLDVEDVTLAIDTDSLRHVRVRTVRTVVPDLSAPPADTEDAYLRLHLLSHRLVRPRTVNLDGIFGLLPNVAWTSLGPVPVEQVAAVRLRARARGVVMSVHGVDKFPRMVDYVVPSGVRIADADRVRLGAHLADGTTVMHEGFVNFNAGTLGASMVEGRISAGVVVGNGSDVGGGASIMGTLSGGGAEVISIGERCLIGANAGIGHLPRRRLRGGGRLLHDGRLEGHAPRRPGRQGRGALRGATACCSGGTRCPGRWKPYRARASWGGLNADLHAND